MNRLHNKICQSEDWFAKVERETLPWALRGVDLGDSVLEIGPGFGATTKVLCDQVPKLTVLEIDAGYAARLTREYGDRATVIQGDGTAIPLPDNNFSGVVCFTMLHHIPSAQLQDRLFAEAFRVLKSGGVFAGCDSQPTLRWRIVHIGDTSVVIKPATLPQRLAAAGFTGIEVETVPRKAVKFRAHKP